MNNEKIIINFNENHHYESDTAWSLGGLWINNITNEPCLIRPCQICIEADEAGINFDTFTEPF